MEKRRVATEAMRRWHHDVAKIRSNITDVNDPLHILRDATEEESLDRPSAEELQRLYKSTVKSHQQPSSAVKPQKGETGLNTPVTKPSDGSQGEADSYGIMKRHSQARMATRDSLRRAADLEVSSEYLSTTQEDTHDYYTEWLKTHGKSGGRTETS